MNVKKQYVDKKEGVFTEHNPSSQLTTESYGTPCLSPQPKQNCRVSMSDEHGADVSSSSSCSSAGCTSDEKWERICQTLNVT